MYEEHEERARRTEALQRAESEFDPVPFDAEAAGGKILKHAQPAFFGGVQASAREEDGTFSGGGDPRRGGAAVVVD